MIRLQPARKGTHTLHGMYSAVACGFRCFVNSMPKYPKESAHAKRAPPYVDYKGYKGDKGLPNVKTGTSSPLESTSVGADQEGYW
eukprot:42535-Pelagomonas_calceolata.AAC.1